jgi:hypothetical protein
MSLSWKEVLILGLIPMGQLYARVINFNGSLDKKWLLFPLFMIPPFQFIATLMMKFGMFKKGKGGKPYDWFMLIPLIVRIILSYVLERFDMPVYIIIDVIVSIIATLIPSYLRTRNLCQEYNTTNMINTFVQGVSIEAAANIFSVVIGWVPLIGMIFTLLEFLPVIGESIAWMLAYSTGYIVMNMFNTDDSKSFCLTNKYKLFMSIISIIIITALKSVNYYL